LKQTGNLDATNGILVLNRSRLAPAQSTREPAQKLVGADELRSKTWQISTRSGSEICVATWPSSRRTALARVHLD